MQVLKCLMDQEEMERILLVDFQMPEVEEEEGV